MILSLQNQIVDIHCRQNFHKCQGKITSIGFVIKKISSGVFITISVLMVLMRIIIADMRFQMDQSLEALFVYEFPLVWFFNHQEMVVFAQRKFLSFLVDHGLRSHNA